MAELYNLPHEVFTFLYNSFKKIKILIYIYIYYTIQYKVDRNIYMIVFFLITFFKLNKLLKMDSLPNQH